MLGYEINGNKIQPNLIKEVSIVPRCPFYPEVAENILLLLTRIPPFDFEDMEDFQVKLIVEYWHYFDALDSAFEPAKNISQWVVFRQWAIQKATPPERIRRASQWLIEPKNGYITVKQRVRSKALETAERNRQAIGTYNATRGNG
jgi:hypothetical protein